MSAMIHMKDVFAGASIQQFLLAQPGQPDRQSEAFAFCMHAFARAPVAFVITAFLSPYLTSIARFVAAESYPYNQVKWFGMPMLATSYVAVFSAFTTVLTTVLTPYLGAISDLSPHRRLYLILVTSAGGILTMLMGFIGRSTWWLGGVLVIMTWSCYEWSLIFVYAYLPEVGKTDEERNHVSVVAVIVQVASQIVIMGIIAIVVTLSEPASLLLENGSFNNGATTWLINTNISSLNSPTLGPCGISNDACQVSATFIFDKSNALFINSSNNIGLYQENIKQEGKKDLQSRNLLLTANIVKPEQTSPPGWRLWQNDVVSKTISCSFLNHVEKFDSIYCWHSTSNDVQKLAYEFVIQKNSDVYLGNMQLYSEPSRAIPYACSFAGCFWFVCSLIAFVHFKPRQNVYRPLVDTGNWWKFFTQVNLNLWDTIKLVSKTPRTLIWYCANMFYAAGASAIVSLAGTYFKEQLGLSSGQIGLILLCCQIFGVPSSLFLHALGKRIGFHVALLMVYFGYMIGITLGYLLLVDSSTPQLNVWIVSSIVGASLGAGIALSRSVLSGMIPRGREAEYMGLYVLSGKVLTWLGPSVFTAVNETTGEIRKAFLALLIPFVIAAILQAIVVLMPQVRSTHADTLTQLNVVTVATSEKRMEDNA